MANNYGQTANASGLGGVEEAQSASVINITDENGPWLVTLCPVRGAGAAALPNGSRNYRARVEWGAGGVRQKADIDWPVNGGTFVVSSRALSVIGVFTPGAAIAGTPPQTSAVQFTAFAARCEGPRAANAAGPPRRTITVGALALGGGVVTSTIPAHARNVRYVDTVSIADIMTSGNTLNLLLEWMDIGGVAVLGRLQFYGENLGIPPASFLYGLDFLALMTPVPVHNQAITVRLTNNGTRNLSPVLVYDIDIG